MPKVNNILKYKEKVGGGQKLGRAQENTFKPHSEEITEFQRLDINTPAC